VINDLQKFKMSRINAEEFTEIYRKVIPQYHEVVDQLISGPVLAMEVTAGPRMQFKNIDDPSDPQANLVSSFRYFTGPLDPKTARQVRPESLRARFGSDTVRNAIHCTDLAEDAQLEVEYFFQILAIQ
jgi:nucleoside-diphosphate kinase